MGRTGWRHSVGVLKMVPMTAVESSQRDNSPSPMCLSIRADSPTGGGTPGSIKRAQTEPLSGSFLRLFGLFPSPPLRGSRPTCFCYSSLNHYGYERHPHRLHLWHPRHRWTGPRSVGPGPIRGGLRHVVPRAGPRRRAVAVHRRRTGRPAVRRRLRPDRHRDAARNGMRCGGPRAGPHAHRRDGHPPGEGRGRHCLERLPQPGGMERPQAVQRNRGVPVTGPGGDGD